MQEIRADSRESMTFYLKNFWFWKRKAVLVGATGNRQPICKYEWIGEWIDEWTDASMSVEAVNLQKVKKVESESFEGFVDLRRSKWMLKNDQ